MDRLQTIEIFVTVADAGGFARAAERLRLSRPAVSRAVAALEERLGVRLLNRTTRSVAPTEAGRQFLESARELLQQVQEAEQSAAGVTATPSGTLSISAPLTFGRHVVAPVAAAFVEAHPQVSASLLLTDRIVSLVEEGVDVAVRIGELPDSSLVARPVGRVQRVLVASPDYLARHGTPRDPSDLRGHAVLAFTGMASAREWRHQRDGRPGSVRVTPRIEANDAATVLALAQQGQGIAPALCSDVREALFQGRLVRVLPEFAPPPLPVHLVYAQSRLVAPKLRAFLDFAARHIRAELEKGQPVLEVARPAA